MEKYKLKIKLLSKDEQKLITSEFNQSRFGKSINQKILIVKICSIITIIYSFYLVIDNFIQSGNYWQYSYALLLFISAIVLYGYALRTLESKINSYYIKTKKK